MRIAVISDIHGNLLALEAVRADFKTRSPDLVINLGDHVSGPLQAAATADLLMSEAYVSIRGNHDRQLLDRPAGEMGASDRAAFAQLQSRHKAWLEALPAGLSLEQGILVCHGTPASDLDYLLEEVSDGGVRLAPAGRIQSLLPEAVAPLGVTTLVLCGHSHVPRVVSIGGGVRVVNPGSVGLPAYDADEPQPHCVETGSPHARYAILDGDRNKWKVDLVAVEYDWDAAAKEAIRGGRAEWAHALRTGYALRERSIRV